MAISLAKGHATQLGWDQGVTDPFSVERFWKPMPIRGVIGRMHKRAPIYMDATILCFDAARRLLSCVRKNNHQSHDGTIGHYVNDENRHTITIDQLVPDALRHI